MGPLRGPSASLEGRFRSLGARLESLGGRLGSLGVPWESFGVPWWFLWVLMAVVMGALWIVLGRPVGDFFAISQVCQVQKVVPSSSEEGSPNGVFKTRTACRPDLLLTFEGLLGVDQGRISEGAKW